MIFVFVIFALCGFVSADVSEIIKPSRDYLPPSREYLPPAQPKLLTTSSSTPAITTLYQEDLQPPSTPQPIIAQDILVQSTVLPDAIKSTTPAVLDKVIVEKEIIPPVSEKVAPIADEVSIQRQYLPPLPVISVVPQTAKYSVQNHNLPPLPTIAEPNEVTINSDANQDDLEILTNIIQHPLNTITVPQIPNVFTTDLTPTTIASQPSVVTFISETTPVSITTQPTSVPEYIQNISALSSQDNLQTDPLIRINASELSEPIEQISELPATLTDVSTATPETILSEDGYHYSIPLISFGSLNKK